jgi:hypothetical protein
MRIPRGTRGFSFRDNFGGTQRLNRQVALSQATQLLKSSLFADMVLSRMGARLLTCRPIE